MARVPVCVRVEEKDLVNIDKKSEECSLSRAEVIRLVLHEFARKKENGFELRHGGK